MSGSETAPTRGRLQGLLVVENGDGEIPARSRSRVSKNIGGSLAGQIICCLSWSFERRENPWDELTVHSLVKADWSY